MSLVLISKQKKIFFLLQQKKKLGKFLAESSPRSRWITDAGRLLLVSQKKKISFPQQKLRLTLRNAIIHTCYFLPGMIFFFFYPLSIKKFVKKLTNSPRLA